MASSAGKVATVLASPRRAAAARLRRARVALGLTQEQVPDFAKARGCEVSVRTVRDLEAGRPRMTALELALVLEAAASSGPNESGEADETKEAA
jgi:transcriptional regulator with XRE-family HTH domain